MSFLPLLFIYSVICLCQYGLKDIHFYPSGYRQYIYWIYVIYFAHTVPSLAIGSPFRLVRRSPSSYFSDRSTFWHYWCFMLIFHLFAPALEPTTSPRNSGSFNWRITINHNSLISEHCDNLKSTFPKER